MKTVQRRVAPFTYEAGDVLPDDYRDALRKLFSAHGECMMPYFGAAGAGRSFRYESQDIQMLEGAVHAEARLRASNFRAEEFKHQYMFYTLYREFDPSLPIELYEEEQARFRIVETSRKAVDLSNWTERALYNCVLDRFGVYQGLEWVQSSYGPLARVALVVCKDERGHSNMGYIHLRESIATDPVAREFAQERLREYWIPYALDAFGNIESSNNDAWREFGLKLHTNEELRQAFYNECKSLFGGLGLEVPPYEHNRTRL